MTRYLVEPLNVSQKGVLNMAFFKQSPACSGVWSRSLSPADAAIEATLRLQAGQTAEFLLWGGGPGNEKLTVRTDDGSPVVEDTGPPKPGPDLRRFRTHSAIATSRYVYAKLATGVDYAAPI